MNPKTATEAVLQTAARFGIQLSRDAARALATAALTHADNKLGITRAAHREQWEDPGYREYTRKQMHHTLLEALFKVERLPVTLPAENLTYHMGLGTSSPVPETAPWDMVHIHLQVLTREARGN